MKEFKVLTVRDLNFKDNNGNEVSGMQLWVDCPSEEHGWNGYEVIKIWVPAGSRHESLVASLKRDDRLHLTFNRFGKPDTMEVL